MNNNIPKRLKYAGILTLLILLGAVLAIVLLLVRPYTGVKKNKSIASSSLMIHPGDNTGVIIDNDSSGVKIDGNNSGVIVHGKL
jgi:hypothetical protein